MSTYIERPLFGGAIVAKTERNLIDASDLRQIPDTQEVFLDPNSSVSVIVEILQRVEPEDPVEAVNFHFKSLAHDNDAEKSTVQGTSLVANDRGDATPSAILLEGEQIVRKFNRASADRVKIFMGLFRVKEKNTDIVVTFNVPIHTTDDSGEVAPSHVAKYTEDFNVFVRSFEIKDFGLFA
ncbi:hypothetical protein CC2G_006001 [Coprinopsis cinerea AmutBmut pab1-1]|nr:hypothetical protein CC2G_006001 [Coprinopsis cinerea AmutBmut pab1-1]